MNATTRLAAAAAALLTLPLFAAAPAHAAEKLYTPYVEQGEWEVEYFGNRSMDKNSSKDNAQAHELSVGYAPTAFWRAEVAVIYEKEPQDRVKFEAWEVENIFQLTQQGEYWMDVGALVAFEHTPQSSAPDAMEARVLLAKNSGKFSHVFNAILGKEVGPGPKAGVEATLLWSSRYSYSQYFEPGFEISSSLGEVKNMGGFEDQQHAIGPAVYGKVPLHFAGQYDALKYRVGYLFGVSDTARDGEAVAQLEYELHF